MLASSGMSQLDLEAVLARLEARLDAIDQKLDGLTMARRKSMEWIGQLSLQISSLDSFREEVRATLEPLFAKLEGVEDNLRILRHATSDVSRRVDEVEGGRVARRDTRDAG
jgi:chromosome segregation ATPase